MWRNFQQQEQCSINFVINGKWKHQILISHLLLLDIDFARNSHFTMFWNNGKFCWCTLFKVDLALIEYVFVLEMVDHDNLLVNKTDPHPNLPSSWRPPQPGAQTLQGQIVETSWRNQLLVFLSLFVEGHPSELDLATVVPEAFREEHSNRFLSPFFWTLPPTLFLAFLLPSPPLLLSPSCVLFSFPFLFSLFLFPFLVLFSCSPCFLVRLVLLFVLFSCLFCFVTYLLVAQPWQTKSDMTIWGAKLARINIWKGVHI